MEDTEGQSFDLTCARLRTSGRWTPAEAEVQLCRDIVTRVAYPVPARDTPPRPRYVTLSMFFYDAMDAVRAVPPNVLPAHPSGPLAIGSLAVFLTDATVPANEIIVNGWIDMLDDEALRKSADDLEPGVIAFRRAIGTVAGADESFWTPAPRGQGPLYNIRPRVTEVALTMTEPDEPEPKPRRRWPRWRR
jgi:hypothetical protein